MKRLLVTAAALLLVSLAACGGVPAEEQAIPRALVSADGRTITVPAIGGGCVAGVRLTATESATEVSLRLTARLNGMAVCPADVELLQASTVLPQPLGKRRLVDELTGDTVPYIPGQGLARPGWLPPGASRSQNQPLNGWNRVYTFPKNSRLEPVEITEDPGHFGDPRQLEVTGAFTRTVHVDGMRARLVIEREPSGRLDQVSVGWMAGGYSILVSGERRYADQRALSPRTVLHIARALRVPAASG